MERRFRQRVREIEKQINEEKRKRKEEWIEIQAYWRPQARFHAAAVAAIVLQGKPKIDEPLERAWLRALERYGIHVSDPWPKNSPANVGPQLLAKLLKPGADEFRHVFGNFQRCTSMAVIVHFRKDGCEVAEFRATRPK